MSFCWRTIGPVEKDGQGEPLPSVADAGWLHRRRTGGQWPARRTVSLVPPCLVSGRAKHAIGESPSGAFSWRGIIL